MNATDNKNALAFLPLSKPSLDEHDIQAVVEVLRSGWITTGAKAAELEQLFCQRLGCKHAIALTSATAGMHLLLHAMQLGPGDEVITPSMTWVSTVNLIVNQGATPVFADINKDTLMASAEHIAPCITERTKLIIPVHYAGAALELQGLRQLATKHRIALVEDAAHAVGTCFGKQPIGQQGTAIFSLHPIKNITTGEGGMFCTDDAELADQIRQLKFHGLGVDAYDRLTQGRSPQAEVLLPGFKYNLPDMNAVLGIGQMKRLDSINQQRRELAALYSKLLRDVDEIMPLQQPAYDMTHAWHLYIVRLDVNRVTINRDQFMEQLKLLGIGSGLHFRAAHTHRFYREYLAGKKLELPHTDWNSERIFSLPLYPAMQQHDVVRIVDAIKSIIKAHKKI